MKVGIVKELEGIVQAQNDSANRTLKVGDELYANETIIPLTNTSSILLALEANEISISYGDSIYLDSSVTHFSSFDEDSIVNPQLVHSFVDLLQDNIMMDFSQIDANQELVSSEKLSLHVEDILDYSVNQLKVFSDEAQEVIIDQNKWENTQNSVEEAGHRFDVYSNSSDEYTLLIEDDISIQFSNG